MTMRAALAAAGAHRGHTDAAAAALQLVDQRRDHARAGCGDGVPEAAAAAGEVDQLFVEAVLAARRDRHRGERLVDLPQRHVGRLQSGTVEDLADDLDAAEAGVAGSDAHRAPCPDSGHAR